MLRFFCRIVLAINEPMVIGITGTVGKTSAKEAIAQLLEGTGYGTRKSHGNLNNEFGASLSILGVTEQPRSIFHWLGVIGAFFRGVFQKYPETLVLELAIDRPGDMEFFASYIPLDIAVVTALGQTHAEFFESREALWAEKLKISRCLKSNGVVLINSRLVDSSALSQLDADYVLYSAADYKAELRELKSDSEPRTDALLAALAVGRHLKISVLKVLKALKKWSLPEGRLTVLKGKFGTVINDAYNASPQSMTSALNYLAQRKGSKMAILGDMRELGKNSSALHKQVGEEMPTVDYLVTVGKEAKQIGQMAASKGKIKNNRWLHLDEVEDNEEAVLEFARKSKNILIKGSRALNLDKLIPKLT